MALLAMPLAALLASFPATPLARPTAGAAAPASDSGGLRPFRAEYEVYLDGKRQGASTMTLQRDRGGLWRYTLSAEGTRGLARLAGFETEQDSEFRVRGGRPRLERSRATSSALLRSRDVVTEFDWQRREARWSGDVKADRRGPVPLSDDALNAHLLNLALALDLPGRAAGETLRYRLLERGRASEVGYTVGTGEAVEVPLGRVSATPLVSENRERGRVTTVWYASGLPPTPVRLLQMEHGRPKYELRLSRIETP